MEMSQHNRLVLHALRATHSSELERVEASAMGVKTQETVASLRVQQQVARENACVFFGQGGEGCHLAALNESPM